MWLHPWAIRQALPQYKNISSKKNSGIKSYLNIKIDFIKAEMILQYVYT